MRRSMSEVPHWSSSELAAVLAGARDDFDRTLLGVFGLMGPRSGEARALEVRHYFDEKLSVMNSGRRGGQTKTPTSRRILPVPKTVQPWLDQLVEGRPRSAPIFESSRKKGESIGKGYVSDALARALANANRDRESGDKIKRINAHALRHTYVAMALSEAGVDLLSVSKALGHAKPSITLNEYGHLAPAGLATLVAKVDALVGPLLAEGKATDV
jgi:integrase